LKPKGVPRLRKAVRVGEWIGTDGALPALAAAARSYWLGVFPDACREVRIWRALAAEIPDPALRRIALRAHTDKRGNLEGAAAFAAFARPAGRHAAVRAAVAYQTMFDYLDDLAEQPSENPIADGRRLGGALLAAVTPGAPHDDEDYYPPRRRGEDGGYLQALIGACNAALTALPSFATIAELTLGATARVVTYQSLNHGDGNGRHDSFERWARASGRDHTRLRWWETGAAAGSTLDVLALIAAAADPALDAGVARRLGSAYFPWVGALHSLLDSLADRTEDLATGRRGLIDYYSSPDEAADRIAKIATEAMSQVGELPGGHSHTLIVAAMTSFYLCDLSLSSSPHARLATPAVLEAMGRLARPTMLILGARRAAARASERLLTHLSRRRRRPSHHACRPERARVLESGSA
jgi:tetraprenyl-beta-curcumene synthase